MLLIKACRVDTAQALRQNAIVQAFFKEGVSCGRVPNKKGRQRMSYKKQMQHAKEYAQELSSNESVDEGNSIYVPRHGLHRPPNKKPSGATHKVGRRERQSKTKPSAGSVSAKNRIDLPPPTQAQRDEQAYQPLVVTVTAGIIRVCSGCERDMRATHEAPNDLIMKKQDFKEYKHKGEWHRQNKLVNTYYDLDMACVRKKFPFTQISDIIVYKDNCFKPSHVEKLHNFGIHGICSHM